jgi:hypothetical protein
VVNMNTSILSVTAASHSGSEIKYTGLVEDTVERNVGFSGVAIHTSFRL